MMNLTINFDALMEDVKGIRHAYAFRMTSVMKQNGIEEHQKDVVAVEDNKMSKSYSRVQRDMVFWFNPDKVYKEQMEFEGFKGKRYKTS